MLNALKIDLPVICSIKGLWLDCKVPAHNKDKTLPGNVKLYQKNVKLFML